MGRRTLPESHVQLLCNTFLFCPRRVRCLCKALFKDRLLLCGDSMSSLTAGQHHREGGLREFTDSKLKPILRLHHHDPNFRYPTRI